MTAQPRAAIYVRVSSLEQSKEGYSLEAQEQDCKRLAADVGAAVVVVLRDTDKGDLWDLPGLNALLDGAKRRDSDLGLCYEPGAETEESKGL